MKLTLPAGTTSQIVHVFIQDSTVTTGAGKTALIHSDITAYYVRAGGTLTALTMETIVTLGTWASTGNDKLGFKLLHDTNAPGLYELDLPNNILAAGSSQVTIQLRATGAAIAPIEIQLAPVPAALANGAHGGAAATLTLLSAVVNNSAGVGLSVTGSTNGMACAGGTGPGLVLTSTSDAGLKSTGGTNHPAAELLGTGTGAGLEATGGLTGNGIKATGGATGGQGLSATGTGNNVGLYALGNGVAPGLQANGGLEGSGLVAVGGTTSGHGISATATDGHGMRLAGGTAGEGLSATGGVTGNGIQATGGATSGVGLYANAQNSNNAGIQAVANGTGDDLAADNLGVAQTGDCFPNVALSVALEVMRTGVSFFGIVTAVDAGNNKFTIDAHKTLIPQGAFKDATAPYRAFVMWDAGGLAAAPQGETQSVTNFISATGEYTTAAFTSPVGVGDYVIIMHPRLAELLSIKTETDKIAGLITTVGAAGAGLTALGDARLANLDAAVTTRSSHSAADVVTALEVNGSKLDHLWEMTEDDAGTRRLTTNALEQAPTGGSAPTAAAIRQEIDSNSTQLAAIVADTNELQAELADGGRTDLLVDAIKAKTDLVPASPAAVGSQMDLVNAPNATAVTALQSGLAKTGADSDTLETLSDQIDGVTGGAAVNVTIEPQVEQ